MHENAQQNFLAINCRPYFSTPSNVLAMQEEGAREAAVHHLGTSIKNTFREYSIVSHRAISGRRGVGTFPGIDCRLCHLLYRAYVLGGRVRVV